MEDDVNLGRLSRILLKPVRYPLLRFFTSLSGKPVDLPIRVLVYFLVAYFFKGKLIINLNLEAIFLTLVSFFLGRGINFLIDFLVGLIAFWTISLQGISRVARTIKSIFSGLCPYFFFSSFFPTCGQFTAFYLYPLLSTVDLSWQGLYN